MSLSSLYTFHHRITASTPQTASPSSCRRSAAKIAASPPSVSPSRRQSSALSWGWMTSSPPESQGTAVVLAALLQGTVPVLRADEMPLSAPPPPPPRRSPDLNRRHGDDALKENHREAILRSTPPPPPPLPPRRSPDLNRDTEMALSNIITEKRRY
jgi:hypothetical protein